ncbi:MAG: ATP-grasp domain-containing protein [Clostridia bacterium]|nr:ATP-grasp domain-containing protein [Clostridia bacterium]
MRVMVLGGGSNQVELIKKVKQEGDEAILIDYQLDCPGKKYADMHIMISTQDAKNIKRIAQQQKIDAIVTAGADQPVLTAAIVSAELGIGFYADPELAKAVTNKILMKSIFTKNNIPTPKYCLIKKDFSESDISSLNFPLVLKPVDCQGQRGVYKIFSTDEIRLKIASTLSYSMEDVALLEEFYENDEITVNGWLDNGELKIISVVDRITIKQDNHIGICPCHNFPSVYFKKYHDELISLTHEIVSAFNMLNGPVYFQYLLGDEGLKVNEVAMRIGAAYESITIPMIANIDITKMVLDYCKYNKADTSALKDYSMDNNQIYLSTQMFFCDAGTIAYMTPLEDILNLPFVKAAQYGYQTGDTVKRLVNATARAGYFVVEGCDFDDMLMNVDFVFDYFEILDSKGNNLVKKYNSYPNKYLFS